MALTFQTSRDTASIVRSSWNQTTLICCMSGAISVITNAKRVAGNSRRNQF